MHIKKSEFNEDFLRYMVLNSIRAYNTKLFKNRGEVIIACDSKNNWRRDVFPYYKAKRKQKREESQINWAQVFDALDNIKSELKEYFPYTVIDVERAEADDIIATLSKLGEKTLIISGDGDFVQLQDGFLIEQYNPVKKKFIKNTDKDYLKKHIIYGDAGDGVPNIMSADDVFITGKHQKRITKKRLNMLLTLDPEEYPSVERRNYFRNKELIDLNCTPIDVKSAILNQYETRPKKNKSKLFNYFFDKKLTKFMNIIQEF
jgi:hypothetical protein